MLAFMTMTGAKPFDLAGALESWAGAGAEHQIPEFKGKPKRKDDLPIHDWLDRVEKACGARGVPRTHWPDVAKHFMGRKARGRVLEVEKVMRVMQGEQWAWTWKAFRVALMNMGWNIDEKKTREVNVERKAAGLWRIVSGGNKDEAAAAPSSSATNTNTKGAGSKAVVPVEPKSPSKLFSARPAPTTPKKDSSRPIPTTPKKDSSRPAPTTPKKEKESPRPAPTTPKKDKEKDKEGKPTPRTSSLFSLPSLPFHRAAAPEPEPEPTMLSKISAQVPLWLLATTEALAALANDNPDVLTAIATMLVAVGTISGGGTAIAAVGEAAVSVGRALKTAHDRVSSGHGHHGH